MNWTQILSTIILVVGVFGSVLEGIHIAGILSQKLPEHTRLALEQFARQAAQQIEQQYQHNPGKKALAQSAVIALFKAFNLPAPPPQAIDIAIEAAVWEINRSSSSLIKPADVKSAELKIDATTTN